MYVRVISGHLDARTHRPRACATGSPTWPTARLRQRHGLGLHDPARASPARREVADLLTGPPRRLSRDEIDRRIGRIEEL